MKTGTLANRIILSSIGFFLTLFFAGATAQSLIVGDIPDQTILEGGSFSDINLNSFINDPDPKIKWSYTGADQLSVNIDNSNTVKVLTPDTDWNGVETVTFTATDTAMNTASDNATFAVTPVNDPPMVSGIQDQSFDEGTSFQPINLDDYVTDVDNSKDQLTWSASGNTSLSVDINASTHIATINVPDINWNGSENITFKATDPETASGQDDATFSLNAVNDPPVIGDIPDQTIHSGQSFNTITLDDYVTDVDNSKADLTWTITGNTNLTPSIDGSHVATINKPSNWTGSEKLTFTVTDPSSASASDDATFEVKVVATSPVAADDSYSTNQGATLNIGAPGVLLNDTDADLDPLTTIKVNDPSHGTVTLNSDGSFTYVNDGTAFTSDAFTYKAFDGSNESNVATVNITINLVNSPPALGDIEGSALAYTEGDGPVNITGTITATDADNTNLASAVITISSNYQNGEDVLSFTNANGISGVWSAAGGQLTLSGSSSVANYQAALRSVKYTNNSAAPSTLTRTVSFMVNDGTDNSNTQSRNISVTGTNSPPVLASVEGSALAYTEGDGPVNITGTITATDADNTNLASAVITISSNYQNGEDVLSFTNANGISGVWSAAGGQLTLSGSSSVANYRTALRAVKYTNNSAAPSTLTRTVSFMVNDGTDNSNTQSRNISVTGTNSPPVLASVEGSALAYTEGDGPVNITGTITATDADNTNLASAVITISSNYQNGEDVLSFTNANGISGVWSAAGGQLTLSGSSSVANYRTALRAVKYTNNSASPSTLTRTVSFMVNDGTDNSNTQSRNISVTGTNSPPVLASVEGSALAYTEGDGPVNITGTITATDADNTNLASAVITISSNYQNGEDVLSFTNANGISGVWSAAGGQLTLSGSSSVANYRTALRAVKYTNNSASPSTLTRTVSFMVNDGTDNSNTQSRNISVTGTNSPPVLASVEGSALAYTEGDGPVNITGTITATDADNTNLASAVITISSNYQNGEDVLSFTNANGISGVWSAAGGQLTLSGSSSVANYRTALRAVKYTNNSAAPSTLTRTVSFMVNDGTDNSNTQSRNISVTGTNSPPVLASVEGSALAYTEGDGPVNITGTITATDADNTNLASAVITISSNYQNGEDVLSFTNANGISGVWSAAGGQLTLSGSSSVANYQAALRSVKYTNNSAAPSTLTRTVSFMVNDGTDNSNTQSRNISVTGTNNPPVLASVEGSALAYTEGDGPVNITGTITATDDDNTNLASAVITIFSNYQNGEDVLSFTNANGISGVWSAAGGQLTLSGSSSVANYQAALRSVKYTNNSAAPSTLTRTVSFMVNDGTDNSNTQSRNISVTGTNNPPVLASVEGSALAYTEGDGPVNITGTITATDADNTNLASAVITISSNYQNGEDVLSFTNANGISGVWSAAGGQLTLSGSSSVANYQAALRSVKYANISINPNTDTRNITFSVSDGTDNSTPQNRNISITAVNNPPEIASVDYTLDGRIGVLHTGTFSGYSDPEGDAPGVLTYQWYISSNSGGIPATPVTGATGLTYRPTAADGGKYLCFEVTPVDVLGATGIPVKSPFRRVNDAPVATNAQIYAPSSLPGQIIRGRFTYSDAENNPRGNAIYQWYMKNTASVTPASPGTPIGTDSTYTLKNLEAGKYIWFKVKPVATSGSTPGDSVWSNIIGPIGTFSANISGTAGYCPGVSMPITLSITGGVPPYTAVLTRTGSLPKDTTITGIISSPYQINVKITGSYILTSLSDASTPSDNATVMADAVVLTAFPKPSGVLTGTQSICNDGSTTAPITLDLTGTAPWTFTIHRGTNDTVYSGITDHHYTIIGRIVAPATFRLIAISDAHCTGDTAGSGSVRISYLPSPNATISGLDTICPGGTGNLKVVFAGTSGPWNITYLKDGATPTTISNISNFSYNLAVQGTGTFTLSKVQQVTGCTGRVYGSGKVVPYLVPTASISGNYTICQYTTGSLNVNLTGNSPWKFSYKLNSETPVEEVNVATSPHSLAVNKAGTYTLVDVYDKNCQGTASGSAGLTVTPAPIVSISGLAPAYDKDYDQMVSITGTPTGGTFTGPGLFKSNDNSWFFLPRYAPVGTQHIVYSYRTSPTSCYGYDTAVVRVLEANAIIEFPESRLKYCMNESPFIITGVNLANNTGSFTISGDAGLTDHHDNTATIDPSQLSVNDYTVTYTYFDGTTLSVNTNFEVGKAPVADFKWESECFTQGQSIQFKDTSSSTFGNITGYFWKIYTSTGYDTASTPDIVHTYSKPGNHLVELHIQTSYGCSGSTSKEFGLRPTVPVEEMARDTETFEEQPLSWRSESFPPGGTDSWKLGNPGDPAGIAAPKSGSYCWYTNIPSTSAPKEQSWVTSPCYDFTGMDRPMLSLWIWRDFNGRRDGAVVQATADSGKTWTNIGQLEDGINWYNEYLILGNPGGQSIGWSILQDGKWMESRHSLDMLKGKTRVQFRIAYGSDGTVQNTDGIAFDDFWIGERNRTVLLEHFTNSSDPTSLDADAKLNTIVSADSLNVIDLQYHTSFPGDDPFNEQEPYAPSARLLYYGLSDVPYAILDGGVKAEYRYDYSTNDLDANDIHIETLQEVKFGITLKAYWEGTTVHSTAQVYATVALPAHEFTAHLGILERKVNGIPGNDGIVFENVVRALLPDAAGTTMFKAWYPGEQRSVETWWDPQGKFIDKNQLRSFAFIQDESTREIYQAVISKIQIVTGTNDIVPGTSGNRFIVFPNPAVDKAYVRFDKPVTGKVKIEVFNNLGGLVYSGMISNTESDNEISTDQYPDGLYIIRASTGNELLGIAKLNITR